MRLWKMEARFILASWTVQKHLTLFGLMGFSISYLI